MTLLFRFLVFLVLLLLGRALLSRFKTRKPSSRPAFGPAKTSPGIRTVGETAAKDPQCGTYVDRSIAVSARVGDELLYFCSETCLKQYLAQKKE